MARACNPSTWEAEAKTAISLRLTCATQSTGTYKRIHREQVFPFVLCTPQGELLHVHPPATVQAWTTSTFRSWERLFFLPIQKRFVATTTKPRSKQKLERNIYIASSSLAGSPSVVEPFPIWALGNWGPTAASVHNKYLEVLFLLFVCLSVCKTKASAI